MKVAKSPSDLTYFACQLLTVAPKGDLQAVLDENDLELRMTLVNRLIVIEMQQKKTAKDKRESLRGKFKTMYGQNKQNPDQGKEDDEIQEL